MLTEAILACRGTELDNSDPKTHYDLERLVEWIQKNLPSLYSLEMMKRHRTAQASVEKQSARNRDILLEQKNMRPNIKNRYGTYNEPFSQSVGGDLEVDDTDRPEMK